MNSPVKPLEARLLAQRARASIDPAERERLRQVRVGAVLVTYNSERWLDDCFRGLGRQDEVDLRVYVVDNGSTDGTLAHVAALDTPLRVTPIPLGANRGYAVACNAGIRAALAEDVDYVLILNPDVELLDGALAEMVLVSLAEPRLGPVSPLHVNREGDRVEPGCYWFVRHTGALREEPPAAAELQRHYPIEYLSGAIMLLSRDMLERVGWFDELFFFFGEDNDLCRRSYLAGYPPAVAVRAQAFHWHATYRGLDAFRRSAQRRANYGLILKKPTRWFWLNTVLTLVKFALDLRRVSADPDERRRAFADLRTVFAGFWALRASRARDRARIRAALGRA